MNIALWIAGYLACCALAFWLLQYDWRRTFDARVSDLLVLACLAALGPLGVILGLVVNATSVIGRRLPSGVVWERRK